MRLTIQHYLNRLTSALDVPVNNASLVWFRVVFGMLVSYEVALLLVTGTVEAMFHHTATHFTYLGLGWIRPLPGWGLQLHFLLTLLGGLGITLGLLYRTSCFVFCFGWTWFWLMDKAYFQNHVYLISLLSFWLAFMPANGRFALDVVLWPKFRSILTPQWTLWLLRTLMGIVYFYAGIAKLDSDWLRGMALAGHFQGMADWPLIGSFLSADSFNVVVVAWGGLAFDLLIVPALLWRRTRHVAVFLEVLFHLSNSQFFNIDIFPFLAIGATLLFYPPDWPERLVAKFSAETRESPRSGGVVRGQTTPLLRAGLAIFLVLQVLLPFHHYLYPGNHNWTEEGQRFSWFLMQRSKTGKAMFLVHVPETGQKFTVDPADYLHPRQVRTMAIDPDAILQFAHFLEKELGREYPGDLEIRAFAQVRLNGRPPTELLEHDRDLTRERRHWGHYDWITPAPGD